MAQLFTQPGGRREGEDDPFADDHGWSPNPSRSGRSAEVSRGTSNALSNIDSALAENEAASTTAHGSSSKETSAIPNTDLRKAENEAAGSRRAGDWYNAEGHKGENAAKSGARGYLARLKGSAQNSNRLKRNVLIAGIGGGALGIVGLLIALFLLVSLLKIPGLAANITSYQFARMTRQASDAADIVTQEDLSVAAASDGGILAGTKQRLSNVYSALQDKYQGLKDGAWEKFANVLPGNQTPSTILPSKVIQTLQDDNGFKLHYTLSSTGRKILTSMDLDNDVYPVEQVTGIAQWTPILKNVMETKYKARFISTALPALDSAMENNNVSLGIRAATLATELREQMGITLEAWTASKFVNDDAQAARLEEAREKYAKIQEAATAPDNAVTSDVAQADQDAEAAEQADVNNNTALQADINNNGTSTSVQKVLDSELDESSIADTLAKLVGPAAIAQPVCILYDGSVARSGPAINNQTGQEEAAYYYVASAADQQKAGSADPSTADGLTAAIGATNEDLGDTNTSNAYIRGYNDGDVNTSSSFSAEAGSGGAYDYSIFNALGVPASSATGELINLLVGHLCPVLTNLTTSAAIGILTIITSDGFGDAAEQAAGDGAAAFLKAYVENIITGALVKQLGEDEAKELLANSTLPRAAAYVLRSGFRSFVLKNGTILGLTIGLTEAAHLLVAERSGVLYSGLNEGTDLANEADAGGNFTANQISQTQEFGAPMTKSGVAASAATDNQYVAYQTSQQSAYTRYLDPSYADSLLVRVATDVDGYTNGSFINTLLSIGSSILQPLHSFGSLFSTLTGKASAAAATNYNSDAFDYGNVQFGWSNAEDNLISNNQTSYSPLENQRILDESGEESAIAAKYAQCFGYQFNNNGTDNYDPGNPNSEMQLDVNGNGSIGTLLSSGDISRDSNGNVTNSSALCSPDNLSYDSSDPLAVDNDPSSPEKDDMIFRWRLAMRYDLAEDELLNLQTVTN